MRLVMSLAVKELYETGKFEWMDRETDEDEHR